MSTFTPTQAAPRQRNPHLIFAVVALALFMASIDGTIVAVGIPAMQRDLATTLAWIGWVLTSYMLAQTVVMPMAAKLSDKWGRKRLFLGAVVLFTGSSMAAGFAPNIYSLIGCRVLQGLGGGVFMPSATSIVSDAYGERRRTAIGLFNSIFPLGGIVGPNLGGVIIQHLSWRWMFFVNVPVGIILLLAGLRLLPESQPSGERRRLDLGGAALFVMALVLALSAITAWSNDPGQIGNPITWTLIVVGVGLLCVFVWHELRTVAPIVEVHLLKSRPFLAANLYNLFFGAAAFGFFSFIPYYAVVGYGLSPLESGAILAPRSFAFAVMSTISSFALIRFGYRRPMILGLALMAGSLVLLSFGLKHVSLWGWQLSDALLLSMMVMLAGIGVGVSSPAYSNAALDTLPGKTAAVAGMRGMFGTTGGILGTVMIILALSHFQDKALGMERIFLFLALLSVGIIPFVFMIPDLATARNQAAEERGPAKAESVKAP